KRGGALREAQRPARARRLIGGHPSSSRQARRRSNLTTHLGPRSSEYSCGHTGPGREALEGGTMKLLMKIALVTGVVALACGSAALAAKPADVPKGNGPTY